MFLDANSRINQLSNQFQEQEHKSPYIMQLKSFEDRINRRHPKLKNISSMIRHKKPER